MCSSDLKEEIEQLSKAKDPREKAAKEELAKLEKRKDEEFGTKAGNKLKEWGHKLHHAYTYPIRKMLDGIAWFQKLQHSFYGDKKPLGKLQDEKYREKVANIMYAGIMMTVAGVGVASHLKHLHGVGPALTTIADGVKAGKSLADIVQGALDLA